MYTLYASPHKIKLLKSVLSQHQNLLVRETKFPEYLFVDEDPRLYLSPGLLSGVKIDIVKEGFTRFYKQAGQISELFDKLEEFRRPKPVNPGDMIKIINGRYQGFSGIVKSVSEKGDFEVEISVWGNILKDSCKREEIEKVEVDF